MQHECLSELEICEQQLREDFSDTDHWSPKTGRKSSVSALPPVILEESVLRPGNSRYVLRNYTSLPIYYYPTNYSDALNYPVRPENTSYRNRTKSKTYESLITEITGERHQRDADFRHDSYTSVTGNNCKIIEEQKEIPNISMLGLFTKGVIMSPDIEGFEYHPNNHCDGSDDDHSSLTKPQIDVGEQSHLCYQSKPEIENNQQTQRKKTGHQKFRDDSTNKKCYENSNYRFAAADTSKDSVRKENCQLQKSNPLKEIGSDTNNIKLKIETEIGRRKRSISPIESLQKIEHLQTDSQGQEDSKLLGEVESNDNKIGVVCELLQESSNDNENTENNCHRRQLSHRYPPAQQRRNKEEKFINSLVIQKRSYPVPLSPFVLPSFMKKQSEIPDDSGRQMNGHEAVLPTDAITISNENTRQNGLKIGQVSIVQKFKSNFLIISFSFINPTFISLSIVFDIVIIVQAPALAFFLTTLKSYLLF